MMERIRAQAGNSTLGALRQETGGLAMDASAAGLRIGYFGSPFFGPGVQGALITSMGHVAVPITTVDAASLSDLDVLYIDHWGLSDFDAAVLAFATNRGMVLWVQDWGVSGAASVLPGAAGVTFTTFYGDQIDVADASTLLTNGPGGTVVNSTLDGGTLSIHGYALRSSLPVGAKAILNSSVVDQIVAFSYPYGAGHVFYSTIPLSYYLGQNHSNPNFKSVYAPNAVAYVTSLRASAPVAATLPVLAASITTGSATLRMTLNANGTATARYFVYGTTPGLYTDSTAAITDPATTNSGRTVAVAGLLPGTAYYVRAVGTNANGRSVGDEVSFTTLALPTVALTAPTNLSTSTVTFNGTANPSGSATSAYFLWGTAPGLYTDSTAAASIGSGSADVAITKALASLTPGTTLYYRLVATKPGARIVTTEASVRVYLLASVTTAAATALTTTGATLGGSVNPNGFATSAYVRWGTAPGVYTDSTAASSVGSGSADVALTQAVTGLASGTMYHYQTVATGVAGRSSGSVQAFATRINLPALAAMPPTVSIEPTLDWNDQAGVTSYVIEVATDTDFATKRTVSTGTTSQLPVRFDALPLLNATPYFWRVVATGIGGDVATSAMGTFTTTPAVLANLRYPSPGATGLYPLGIALTWDVTVAGTYTYRVNVDEGSAATPADWAALSVDQATSASPLRVDLSGGTAYQWRVATHSAALAASNPLAGTTVSFTPASAFTTSGTPGGGAAAQVVVPTFPTSTSTPLYTLTPALQWYVQGGALAGTTYQVQHRTAAGAYPASPQGTGLTGLSFTTAALTPGTGYAWQARACVAATCGAWSTEHTFSVHSTVAAPNAAPATPRGARPGERGDGLRIDGRALVGRLGEQPHVPRVDARVRHAGLRGGAGHDQRLHRDEHRNRPPASLPITSGQSVAWYVTACTATRCLLGPVVGGVLHGRRHRGHGRRARCRRRRSPWRSSTRSRRSCTGTSRAAPRASAATRCATARRAIRPRSSAAARPRRGATGFTVPAGARLGPDVLLARPHVRHGHVVDGIFQDGVGLGLGVGARARLALEGRDGAGGDDARLAPLGQQHRCDGLRRRTDAARLGGGHDHDDGGDGACAVARAERPVAGACTRGASAR